MDVSAVRVAEDENKEKVIHTGPPNFCQAECVCLSVCLRAVSFSPAVDIEVNGERACTDDSLPLFSLSTCVATSTRVQHHSTYCCSYRCFGCVVDALIIHGKNKRDDDENGEVKFARKCSCAEKERKC